jgi:heptose I phosphotransferase
MRDRLRFLRTYFARPLREILNTEATLFRHLKKESVRLLKRYQRKYAPEASR